MPTVPTVPIVEYSINIGVLKIIDSAKKEIKKLKQMIVVVSFLGAKVAPLKFCCVCLRIKLLFAGQKLKHNITSVLSWRSWHHCLNIILVLLIRNNIFNE